MSSDFVLVQTQNLDYMMRENSRASAAERCLLQRIDCRRGTVGLESRARRRALCSRV